METKRRELSKIAPPILKKEVNHLFLGDKFTSNLLVTKLPEDFAFGMLNYYISNPNIKVHIKTEPLDLDINKPLDKDLKDLRTKKESTTDSILQKRYENQIMGLEQFIDDTVNSRDSLLNLIMVLSITALSNEELTLERNELMASLRHSGFGVLNLAYMQEELLRLTTPLFIDSKIKKDLQYNYGIPISASSFAGLWPYHFQTLDDEGGFFLGKEINTGGIVKLNPFFYYEQPTEARRTKRMNGNITILGNSGVGKTTTMNVIIRYAIRNRIPFISIDAENKNYYFSKKYNGQFFQFGTKGLYINVLDLQPVSSEDDEDVNPWDTELALSEAVDRFKIMLKNYDPELTSEERNELDYILYKTYEKKGITKDVEFRHLENTNYPIISDILEVLVEERDKALADNNTKKQNNLDRLSNSLTPMTLTHDNFFNHHTNIDLKNNMLAFGTKNLKNRDINLRNALYFVLFRFAWSFCLDANDNAILAIDEGHDILLEGESLKEVSTIYRRSRKYRTSVILGTQQPEDLNSEIIVSGQAASVYGRAILDNSNYKIFHQLSENAVKSVASFASLNANEIDQIQNFSVGDIMLQVSTDVSMAVNVIVTDQERRDMDPESMMSEQ